MTPTEQRELKLKFAAAIIAEPTGDAHKAALSIPGLAPGIAMQIAILWANDETVLEEKHRLLSSSETAIPLMPSKEKQAMDIYALAQNERLAPQDRLKFHELYAKIRGFIEKPVPPAPANQLVIGRNVMIIDNHGSDSDWEKKSVDYQKKLTNGVILNGESDAIN